MNPASFFLSWYRLPYALLMMLMALSSTRELVDRSAELGLRPSAPEAILNVVQDPYIVVVICMLFWAMWVGLTLSTHADPVVMLRHGSRTRWALAQCTSAVREASVVVGILLATALASSAGLPWTSSWTPAAAADLTGALLPLWTTSGVGVVPATLLQLLLTLCGMVAIFAAVMLVTQLPTRHREVILVLACTLAFMAPLALFKLPSGKTQSLITLIAARPAGWPVTPIVALLLLIALVLLVIRILDARPAPPSARAVPALIYAVLVGSLLVLVAARSSTASLQGLLWEAFYGASMDALSLTQYLVHVLIFLGPGYLALLTLGSDSLPRMSLLAVRHGRLWPWLRTILTHQLLAAVLVNGAVLGLSALLAAGAGWTLSLEDPRMVWHQFALNGVLQVYVTTSLTVLVVLLSGSDVAGFGALVLLAVLGVPALTRGFAPSGANMLGLLDIPGYSPWQGTIVLGVTAFVLTFGAYAVTTARAPQRLITGSIHARP